MIVKSLTGLRRLSISSNSKKLSITLSLEQGCVTEVSKAVIRLA